MSSNSHFRSHSQRAYNNAGPGGSSGPHYRANSAGTNAESHQFGNGSGSRTVPIPLTNITAIHDGAEQRTNVDLDTPIDHQQQQIQQLTAEVERLKGLVEFLKKKEKVLTEPLFQPENQRETDCLRLEKREQELAEWERELNLKQSNMESEYKDKKFDLDQKERELQIRADELHMQRKDLKQKEFDIMNADSSPDISSSQLAELAERQYEIERREQDLHGWSINLKRDELEIKSRWDELLYREDLLQNYTVQHPINPTSSSELQSSPHHEPQNIRTEVPDQPQYYPSDYRHTTTVTQGRYEEQVNHSDQRNRVPNYTAPVETIRQDVNYGDSPDLSEEQPSVFMTSAEGQGQPQRIHPESDQYTKDMELARKIQDDYNKAQQTTINTDEMIALALQREQLMGLEDGLSIETSEGAASIIRKELDERLTEEQRRKKQEDEDFILAQRLSSASLTDDAGGQNS